MRRNVSRRKEVTHERIVEAAARAIRRSGYDGTGVATSHEPPSHPREHI